MNISEFKKKIYAQSDRIYPMVARMLQNHTDAEDAIQDIMLKLWHHRNQLGKHPNPIGFVFLTARNHCLDVMKKKARMRTSDHEKFNAQVTANGHQEFELSELISVIEKILSSKNTQQREILMLRDIDGLEYHEIAAMLHLDVRHVRVILSRTRKYVQDMLKKNYSYE